MSSVSLAAYNCFAYCLVPVDCIWNEWTTWSPCDVSCGGGSQTRVRTQNSAQFGGKACVGAYHDYQICSNISCPSEPVFQTLACFLLNNPVTHNQFYFLFWFLRNIASNPIVPSHTCYKQVKLMRNKCLTYLLLLCLANYVSLININ